MIRLQCWYHYISTVGTVCFFFCYFGLYIEVNLCLIFSSCSKYPSQYRWKIISQPFHIPREIICVTDVTDPLCGPTKSRSVCTIVIHFFFCFLRVQVFCSPHPMQRSGRAHFSFCVKATACKGRAGEWLWGVTTGNTDCEERDSPWCSRQAFLPTLLFLITGTNLWGFVAVA